MSVVVDRTRPRTPAAQPAWSSPRLFGSLRRTLSLDRSRSEHPFLIAVLFSLALLGSLFILSALTGCGSAPVPTHLGALTVSSTVVQSGQSLSLILPAGVQTPNASDVTVTMSPVSGSGTSYTLAVNSIGPGSNGTSVLRVTLPTLSITVPTPYTFTAKSSNFYSGFDTTPVQITIQPGPTILSAAPTTVQAGQTVDLTVTGISTAWTGGTTTLLAGPGISVNGSTPGTPGQPQVQSSTQLVAHLTIALTATAGPHDIVVSTGSQTLTLTGALTVTAPPLAPIAAAGGPYTGTTGQPVAFSAAASTDPAGLALTYAWSFGDGSTGTGATPTHTYATAGSYTVAVVVTNSAGVSSSASTTATIADPAKPPVANAGGPYTGTAGTAVAFNGAASTDPKNEILTYAWTFGDTTSATGPTPTHTYAAAGTYTATLTVTNTDKLATSATATVTIAAAPQAPAANAGGPYTGTAGTAVTFNGAASTDPKNETLTYAWTFGDTTSATGPTPTHTYAQAGTYTATLTVTNTDKLATSATATVTIAAAPQSPVANAGGPYTGTAGTAVAFNGTASTDPKNEALTYAWTFGDTTSATGPTPTHTYTVAGTYTATLTVTNTDKLSASATATVTIASAPQAPVANAGGPYTGTAGTAVAFSGSASTDPKNEALTYAWTFGDTTSATGPTPTHTYTTSGTYTATLTVTNTDKLATSATATVTIASAPQAPVANAGGPYTGTAGTAVAFNGSASTDPKNETLTYAWTFGDNSTGTGPTPTHTYTYTTAGIYNATLTVTNTDKLATSATATVTIAAAPQAPVANAGGPYTGTAGTAVSFNGSASTDPKNETLTYAWTFGDTTSATGPTPTHTYAAAGTYTATLTVTNTDKLATSATATVTIAAAPQAPVANAGGPYTGTAGTAVTFNGAASTDPKNETLTYAWTFGDNSTGTGPTPTHTYTAAGTYTATLTVTNTDKLATSATATVTIAAAPQAPVANAGGPYTGTAGTAVAFNGAASTDPKNETLTYAWTFGDTTSGSGPTPTHTYAAAGTYTATLTVTNTDKLATSATATVTIAAAPQAPVANAGGPYTGTAGTAVAFNGSASTDPKNETLTYAWTFGDTTSATGPTPTHTYAQAGTYTATLTVTNTDKLATSATATVTIAAAPQSPVANAGGPYTGTAGTAVAFNGSASTDPKNETLTYAWTFGDTTSATGPTPTHTYAQAGTYTATLTVTNTDKLSASATATVTISAAPQAPAANAGGPYTGTSGTAVSFNGTASTDPKNETLTYAWTFGDTTSATGPTPTHTYAQAGTYTATLTVTNTDSVSSSASAKVTITSTAPLAPVASPGGPYTGTAGIAISFNGSGSSDPANPTAGLYALTFSWNFGDGTSANGASPAHSYPNAGTYNVSVTVQSASGATATSVTTATIAASTSATPAPTANAGGPYTGTAGTAISFTSAGSSDPGNLALTYTWNFGDGAGAVGAQVTHTYPAGGVFSVTLTVFNGTLSNAASTTATIAPATVAPLVANAGGPYTVAVNQPLTVDASKTNSPNGGQLVYAWDFGDGTTASNTPATHTYTAQGTYTLSLAVSDSTGLSNTTTTQVTVGLPAAETITASAGGPYTDVTSHSVTFDASTSFDNLGNPLTFIWDFGDGSTGTGTTPGHAFTNPGTYTVTVTATSGTATAQATAQAVISNSLQVTITSPTANALFGTNTTTITGTISVANLAVTVNGIAAQVSGSSFTATGVSLREGVNLIAATATDGKGGIGTGTVSVIMDATAPTASITSPASGTTVSTSTISVAGMVNDIVTGTVGSNQVSVTVNGVAAQVSNRSFLLPGVLLSPGTNTIKVVVTDLVGNTSQITSTVQYVQPSAQLSLRVISGDAQTAVVHTILPQPLVIQLLSARGTPIAGRPITFTVTRSDGLVEVLPNTAQSLYVTTDATGKASILFQLGSRSGLGVNQITASTPGAAGTVLFTESSTLAAPAQIHALHGENQRGLLGQSLAEAFQVIVSDTYGNPVPGTTITYTSTAGDGTLDHASVITDNNGKASATLTLGQQEGVGNYMVAANFTGNTGVPATFAASAYAPGPASATSVSGVVLDNANTPVPNATVRLLNTNLSTVSDVNGRFSLAGAPVGTVTLSVDGSTSTRTETFPFLSFVLQDLPGQNNTLNKPIYLPSIDINNAQTVGGDDPVTLTMSGVPGVSFTVAPHSVTFPDGTTVGKLSLSQVKSDMVPMAPANGTAPDLIWTLQPAGARFSVPVQVTLPNTRGRAPGAITELYQYDHDLEQFVSAGTGHVSADGSVTMSDPGFGITKAGWGHDYVDPDEDDCPETCDDHNVCTTDTVLPCGCAHTATNGAKCGSDKPGTCQKPGVCNGTHCTGVRSAPGTACDDNMFCTKNDLCDNNAECHGTKIDDTDNPNAATLLPDGFKIEKAFESGLGPLTSFFNAFGYHVTVAPVIVPEYSVRNSCCEAKHDLLSTQTESKLTLGLTLKTAQIPFPAPYGSISIPLTSYYAGLYIQFGVTISGSMSNKTNDCDDSQCVGGSAGVQVDVEAGLGVNAPGDLRISGGITAGVEVKASIFCHKGTFNVGLTDWKAVFAVGLPGGKTWSFEKVVRTAQQLGNNDISWFQ